ncbi:uncharacterized protein C13orf42 [Engraulis encrasicolus]|uniref:uncharacterized protein C13orf42 n=1 Tax=Engraulis encrasicolus TaxID=184585 RepID=UPI002FD55188
MFRKINNVFRPNGNNTNGHRHHRHGDGRGGGRESDYHSACTVRLVRSTSMLVVGETRSRRPPEPDATLKRSKSSVNLEAGTTGTTGTALYYYQRCEDQIWLYSQNQNCLQYLQELVALRRQYTQSIMDLQNAQRRHSLLNSKKKPAPQPPRSSRTNQSRKAESSAPPTPNEPSAPPIPNEEDSLRFLDEIIASCDAEPTRKANVDDGHADVDFIVATSTSEHDLHSNWVLRDPRRFSMDESRLRRAESRVDRGSESVQNRNGNAGSGTGTGTGTGTGDQRKGQSGTASGRRLQRNPIHLPKVVESAFQTLRFKPKVKKKN